MKLFASFLATVLSAAGLPAVGPNYVRPAAPAVATYRDVSDDAVRWRNGAPNDAAPRGEWWRRFGDATLDDLEARALAANQDLRVAAARVEQARAAAGFARSGYWPQLAAQGSFTREQTSRTTENSLPDALTNTDRASLNATWEIDLFGRVRRLNESAQAEAAASAALFESVRLSLTGEVAATYFSLRALEREHAIVREAAQLRGHALELVEARRRNGVAGEMDIARAESELATAQAEAAALANRHAAVQDALAVLVGVPASTFALPDGGLDATPFPVPAGLPAELLERRPDIAAAERTLAAANARIGVAKAAFFPAISLTGGAGFASAEVEHLFRADSRVWSIGPTVYLPIFQGGRNRANLDRSRGAWDEAVAAYRQRVLIAFREVQDALSASRWLAEQAAAQARALTSARRA